MDYKNEFKKLFSAIERDGVTELLNWLENETDFFTAPCSSKFHLACETGLVQHSINVYKRLKSLILNEIAINNVNAFCYGTTDETIAIVTLLHDICKCNMYKQDFRNAKNAQGVWEKVPCYTIDEQFAYGGHGSKSVFLIERFMKLTEEEAVSIQNHMGNYDRPQNDYSLNNAYKQYPLALFLHTADMFASVIDEKE